MARDEFRVKVEQIFWGNEFFEWSTDVFLNHKCIVFLQSLKYEINSLCRSFLEPDGIGV